MGMATGRRLTLVANPGSASRKYALYDREELAVTLHFEFVDGTIVGHRSDEHGTIDFDVPHTTMAEVTKHLSELFSEEGVFSDDTEIVGIGLRIVAPSSYFLEDRLIDAECESWLRNLEPRAPLHISATLHEFDVLKAAFPNIPIVGISDSRFHATKTTEAWNYAIPLEDADRFEIKRFGFHGISVSSVVEKLQKSRKLTPKTIVCHLGSGASVTAIHGGKSFDNSMGYSPLEGLVMATRGGNITPDVFVVLKQVLALDDEGVLGYLNHESGLKGLGGSDDIRELAKREMTGDAKASLALDTYAYRVAQMIGSMAAGMGGADELVFTGTVGERSAIIRERILSRLGFLDFDIDKKVNASCLNPTEDTLISRKVRSKPVFVVPTDEQRDIALRTQALLARQTV